MHLENGGARGGGCTIISTSQGFCVLVRGCFIFPVIETGNDSGLYQIEAYFSLI